ncbi:hypothetical protein MHTCC0001_12040 [Flavobacteriaceae bacterium MHTCC 0001]
MKTKQFPLIIALFLISGVFAQSNLNNYKYVIVPNRFNFLREDDQFKLNGLTHFLFEKYGFSALKEGSGYPNDVMLNNCLALRSDVLKESGMFKTKLRVVLKDCNDRLLYTSEIGESREKEFSVAYHKALRAAFRSIEALNYKYEPKEDLVSSKSTKIIEEEKTEAVQEIKKLKEELKALKKETENIQKNENEVIEIPKVDVQPKAEEIKGVAVESPQKPTSTMLYAQAIDGGFQLVDSSPKVVFKIKKTGLNDVFLVEGKSAIVYKQGNNWVIEQYENSRLQKKELNIKF